MVVRRRGSHIFLDNRLIDVGGIEALCYNPEIAGSIPDVVILFFN
jgi:hypothetical protein